jgi:hypothetical protein
VTSTKPSGPTTSKPDSQNKMMMEEMQLMTTLQEALMVRYRGVRMHGTTKMTVYLP